MAGKARHLARLMTDAGHRRARLRFDRQRHLAQGLAPMRFGFCRIIGLLAAHSFGFEQIAAEHLKRTHHVADLVLALGSFSLGVQVA